MADGSVNSIIIDLQRHLQSANLHINNLSRIAQYGDDELVEKFLSESISQREAGKGSGQSTQSTTDILHSQLYLACFWGFKDCVKAILNLTTHQRIDVNVNCQNKGTLWTPLHAATFQEHGPIVMILLQNGASPDSADSEGRTPKDFASASDKIWGHFGALGLQRTNKAKLVETGIIKKVLSATSTTTAKNVGHGIRLAAYSRPESSYARSDDPFMVAAAGGDVLANDTLQFHRNIQPHLVIYK